MLARDGANNTVQHGVIYTAYSRMQRLTILRPCLVGEKKKFWGIIALLILFYDYIQPWTI
jgi:hypothetical protein